MDAHEREYAAAAQGMADIYGEPPVSLPRPGETVTWRTVLMSHTSSVTGVVIGVLDYTVDGQPRIVADPDDKSGVVLLDPRPWPVGTSFPSGAPVKFARNAHHRTVSPAGQTAYDRSRSVIRPTLALKRLLEEIDRVRPVGLKPEVVLSARQACEDAMPYVGDAK